MTASLLPGWVGCLELHSRLLLSLQCGGHLCPPHSPCPAAAAAAAVLPAGGGGGGGARRLYSVSSSSEDRSCWQWRCGVACWLVVVVVVTTRESQSESPSSHVAALAI